MKQVNLLQLLLLPTAILTSPVAYILEKKKFNPIVVHSTSIIVTHRLVLTTKYPLTMFRKNDLCILAVPQLYSLSEYYISEHCLEIEKKINAGNVDLSAIFLQTAIMFLYRVNAAMIPVIHSIDEPFNLTTPCRVVHHKNRDQRTLPAVIIRNDINSKRMLIELEDEKKFCVRDNGLPVYGESGVIGLVAYDTAETTPCCTGECTASKVLRVVKLFSIQAQLFLSRFVSGGIDIKKLKTTASISSTTVSFSVVDSNTTPSENASIWSNQTTTESTKPTWHFPEDDSDSRKEYDYELWDEAEQTEQYDEDAGANDDNTVEGGSKPKDKTEEEHTMPPWVLADEDSTEVDDLEGRDGNKGVDQKAVEYWDEKADDELKASLGL